MPKEVDIDERRIALAEAAARVIARSGLAATTMRAVAAEAGWTTGALTHYFANKRELLEFTLETSLDVRRSARDGRTRLEPHAALRHALLRVLPTDEDSTRHWTVTVAFCAEAAADPELAAIQQAAYREFRADIVGLVEQTGRATSDHAQHMAERLIATANGVAIQALFDPASWPSEKQHAAIDEALAA